jgi:hypothetical protein
MNRLDSWTLLLWFESGAWGHFLTAALSVFAQLIFQITIFLSNGGAYFIIEIGREFFHLMNGPAMLQDLFKQLYFCLRASRKSAFRPKIFTAKHFVHIHIPFLTVKIMIIFEDSRMI